MIKGAIEVFFKNKESEIPGAGSDGPVATSGRREWVVRKKITDAFQAKKKQRTGTVKITDSETNTTATNPKSLSIILETYADELYRTNGWTNQ